MEKGALGQRFAWIALAATLSLGSGGLAAQEIPEGQSCGGLVCDLGLFGHKTAPKPAAEAPAGVPVPPPQRAAARPEPAPESKRAAVHKKARVAKAVPKAEAPRATAAREGLGAAPVAATLSPPTAASPASSPAASPVAAALSPPPSMMAPPVPPPVPVTPSQPVVLANPYVYSRPLPFMFQSVDPTQSVR